MPTWRTLRVLCFPEGISDPYVYNYYLGIQREIPAKMVLEANYVGTTGHKLFRAENVNRIPGGALTRPAAASPTISGAQTVQPTDRRQSGRAA